MKIIGDLDKKVLVEMLGKSLIGVDIKVNGECCVKGEVSTLVLTSMEVGLGPDYMHPVKILPPALWHITIVFLC